MLTETLARDATVGSLVGSLPRRVFDAALKGIREEQRLVGIDAAPLSRDGEADGGAVDARSGINVAGAVR